MDLFAPSSAVGKTQIIPTTGPHTQFYPGDDQFIRLVLSGQIVYQPEYGPNARVYQPVGNKDAAAVQKMLDDVKNDATAKWLRRLTASMQVG